MSGHGHAESSGGGAAAEAANFIFALFFCFFIWLDDELKEMLDKPHGGHGHH